MLLFKIIRNVIFFIHSGSKEAAAMMKKFSVFVSFLLVLVSLFSSVGIAYRESWDIPLMETLFECGIGYEVLDAVDLFVNHAFVPTENGGLSSSDAAFLKELDVDLTNASELLADVDFLIIPGGRDISPSLYGEEDDSDYPKSLEEDISDYILLKYATENSIPVLGICRGMEMIAVFYGGKLIGDLGEYSGIHLSTGMPYSYHSIYITDKDSLLYRAFGRRVVSGLPSNHHQGVTGLENTPLRVTAFTLTDGIVVIEGVETEGVTGILFHPEKVYAMIQDGYDVSPYISVDDAASFFRTALGEK